MSEVRRGVFLNSEITTELLKGSALFWDNIFVYERLVQEAGHDPALFEIVKPFIDHGIIKVVLDPDEKELYLHDKVYYGMIEGAWEFYDKWKRKMVVNPALPPDSEELIAKATKLDLENLKLVNAAKAAANNRVERRWKDSYNEFLASHGIVALPRDVRKDVRGALDAVISVEKGFLKKYSHPWDESFFKWRNESLMTQLSVCPSVSVDSSDLVYYATKLNGFHLKDAHRYLSGWRGLLPMVNKSSLNEFSPTEIVAIRKKGSWRNAMERLGTLCQEAANSPYDDRFLSEIQTAVVRDYQEALESYRATKKSVGLQLGKAAALTGLSLIPLAGAASTFAGTADPVLQGIRDRLKQRNLPFFLNEIGAE
jgi:hypothetical protein